MANCLVCRVSARSYQSRDNGITFHRFPATRSVICARWKKFAGLAEDYNVKSKRLCSRHFRPDDFVNKSPFRKNLRCGAVPTLCHPSNTPPEEGSEPASTPAPSLEDVLTGSEDPSKDDGMLDSILSETSESNDGFVSQSNNTLESHVDTAIMDHDYIASTNLRKSYPQDHSENNKDESSNQLLLNDVRKELCRLCGQKGTVLAPIFVLPSLNEDVSISSKIEMYLPFKVQKEDPLPTHVCLNCCETVNRWHELYVTSVAANAVLWKTFGGEFNEETSNELDDSMISLKEEIQENEASKNIEFVADVEEQPLVPVKSEENADVICAEYKGKKTEVEILEEKECDEFNKNFVSLRDYSYKCRFCYELFKNSEDRKNHMAMCRQLSTICELCGHEVLCRKDLRRHINLRHLKMVASHRYVCDVCNKCFKSQSGLKHHKMRHVNPISKTAPKYYCEHCCSVFLNEKSYRLHKERHAEGKIKSLFQIKTFQPRENSKGSVSISVYTCPVCQQVFSDMLSLVIHLTTKRAMKCSLCRKPIPCEKRLLLHVCGEWTCQYCGKTFNNRQKWIEHERIHTGERPIKCRICDKTFRSWPARKIHENRHNPCVYECKYCAKTFKNKYKCQDHVACHEGAVFLCGICNKNFCGRKSLWKHRRTIHKDSRETSS